MKALTKLIDARPDLVAQLHPTKNSHIDFNVVGVGSHKKAVWICENGHEYPAEIKAHVRGNGCPYCSGKKATPENNFAIKYPELLKEWHPTKNILDPYKCTPFANRPVWWICPKNHEYPARIANRVLGTKCPYCDGKKVRPEDSLAVKYPELVKQWNPSNKKSPADYMPSSNKVVSWICDKCGKSWDAMIENRTKQHQGCPACCHFKDSRLQLYFYCELNYFYNAEYRFQVNKQECDIYLPDYKIAVEIDGYYWHKDRYDTDKRKAKILSELGITLINIREYGLKEVSENTIYFKDKGRDKHNRLAVSKKLMELLYGFTKDERLIDYQNLTIPINSEMYEEQVKTYPRQLRKTKIS